MLYKIVIINLIKKSGLSREKLKSIISISAANVSEEDKDVCKTICKDSDREKRFAEMFEL